MGGIESSGRDRMTAPAAVVHPDRQTVADRRLVDRPVLALPHRLVGARQHQHLHEAWVARQPIDLCGGRDRILVGDHDRSAEALVAGEPLVGQPVVRGAGHHRGELEVEHLADPEQRVEHRVLDLPRVEQLGLQKGEI